MDDDDDSHVNNGKSCVPCPRIPINNEGQQNQKQQQQVQNQEQYRHSLLYNPILELSDRPLLLCRKGRYADSTTNEKVVDIKVNHVDSNNIKTRKSNIIDNTLEKNKQEEEEEKKRMVSPSSYQQSSVLRVRDCSTLLFSCGSSKSKKNKNNKAKMEKMKEINPTTTSLAKTNPTTSATSSSDGVVTQLLRETTEIVVKSKNDDCLKQQQHQDAAAPLPQIQLTYSTNDACTRRSSISNVNHTTTPTTPAAPATTTSADPAGTTSETIASTTTTTDIEELLLDLESSNEFNHVFSSSNNNTKTNDGSNVYSDNIIRMGEDPPGTFVTSATMITRRTTSTSTNTSKVKKVKNKIMVTATPKASTSSTTTTDKSDKNETTTMPSGEDFALGVGKDPDFGFLNTSLDSSTAVIENKQEKINDSNNDDPFLLKLKKNVTACGVVVPYDVPEHYHGNSRGGGGTHNNHDADTNKDIFSQLKKGMTSCGAIEVTMPIHGNQNHQQQQKQHEEDTNHDRIGDKKVMLDGVVRNFVETMGPINEKMMEQSKKILESSTAKYDGWMEETKKMTLWNPSKPTKEEQQYVKKEEVKEQPKGGDDDENSIKDDKDNNLKSPGRRKRRTAKSAREVDENLLSIHEVWEALQTKRTGSLSSEDRTRSHDSSKSGSITESLIAEPGVGHETDWVDDYNEWNNKRTNTIDGKDDDQNKSISDENNVEITITDFYNVVWDIDEIKAKKKVQKKTRFSKFKQGIKLKISNKGSSSKKQEKSDSSYAMGDTTPTRVHSVATKNGLSSSHGNDLTLTPGTTSTRSVDTFPSDESQDEIEEQQQENVTPAERMAHNMLQRAEQQKKAPSSPTGASNAHFHDYLVFPKIVRSHYRAMSWFVCGAIDDGFATEKSNMPQDNGRANIDTQQYWLSFPFGSKDDVSLLGDVSEARVSVEH